MWTRRQFLASAAALAVHAGALRPAAAATSRDGFTVLRARGGVVPLLGGLGDPTAIWGFNGKSPGPTLKVRQGEELKVRLINNLPEPTSIHWHGVRLPNAMDGTSLTQEPVEPGDSFDYVFAPPDAGTFWYHPHVRSAHQVDRGLYGALIVEEASSPEAMDDVLMVIDDWWLFDSGAINDDTFGDLMVAAHGGRMGNWLTVNGVSRPRLTAPAGERLRLRLINVANARVMRLTVKGAGPHLLAIDGQPLASPVVLAEVPLVLPPGGRADIALRRGVEQVTVIIDINGEAVELATIERKVAPEFVAEAETEAPNHAANEAAVSATVIPKAKPKVRPKVVSVRPRVKADTDGFAPLPANPLPNSLDLSAALPVKLVMEGGANGTMDGAVKDGRKMSMQELLGHGMAWAMNGIAGLADEPLVRVERGRTVALSIDNKTAWPHALHLHGHHVRIAEDTGGEPGWRDTVLIEPQAVLTLAFLADNPGKWVLQCHVLDHAEAGLITWLEVI